MGRPTKIAIQTVGSRGDAQPYIAIGSALKSAGYQVTILTNHNHITSVEESGLEGAGVFFDSEKAMKENGVLKKSMAEGDVNTFMGAMDKLQAEFAGEMAEKWFEAMERIKPDLLVSGTLCEHFGVMAAQKLKIPVTNIFLQATPLHPKKMIYGLPNLPCGLNSLLMQMLVQQMYKGIANNYGPVIQKMKGFQLNEIFTKKDLVNTIAPPEFPTLVGVSPVVAKVLDPSPAPNVQYCGHFSVAADDQIDAVLKSKGKGGMFGSLDTLETIKSFLSSGSKPIFMGWGSMTAKSPEYMVELVARAVQFAGSRAIVYQGWANMSVDTLRKATKDSALIEYAENNLLFVGTTPHDWLFPQCSCIVHHGGSGTMATAARAGVPQIITPVFLDQWDHAYFLNRFGSGVGFEKKQLTRLTVKELGEAVKKCESDAQIQAKAVEWQEIVKSENGLQRVVEHVEWFWTNCVETGKFEKANTQRLAAIQQEAKRSWLRRIGQCCTFCS